MKSYQANLNRRSFIGKTTTIAAGLLGLPALGNALPLNNTGAGESLFVIGPMEGYSPHIGTIVSMLNYNRQTIINAVKSLSREQLDYLHDPKANTIGALILHLGAIDKYYQINSFEGRQDFNEDEKKIWEIPMNLGVDGRKVIKGHDVKYYLDAIAEVREKTLKEFKKKDDDWLLAIDPEWSKTRPLNNYWKWFHVCEHESNHRGQITWLKNRFPGAKEGND